MKAVTPLWLDFLFFFLHYIKHINTVAAYIQKCGTNLRLNKPPFLPAASIAGLEMVGRVDSNAMVGVIQCGKVVPGCAKMRYSGIRSVAMKIKMTFEHTDRSSASVPVLKALTETGGTRRRRPPLWHLLSVEILYAFWLILEQNNKDSSVECSLITHRH